MSRWIIITLSALVLAACAGTPQGNRTASGAPKAQPPEIVDPDTFLEFLDALDNSIQQGEPRELNSVEMKRYASLSGKLRSALTGIDTIDELSENEQMRVFNINHELWATVIGRDEDRLICRREHTIGTNFKSTRCRTISEIRAEQREADNFMRNLSGRSGPMPQGN